MSEGKNSRFPRARFAGVLAASCALGIGLLTGEAQEGNPATKVSTGSAPPESKAEVLPEVVVTGAAPANDPKADKAWRELERAEKAVPHLPVGFCWKLQFQSVRPEDVGKFLDKSWVPDDLEKADKARDFCARFPQYPKVWDARIWEYDNLIEAAAVMASWDEAEASLRQRGLPVEPQAWSFTNLAPRIMTLEKILMGKTNLPRSSQLQIRSDRVEWLAAGAEQDWLEAAKALQKDFPEEERAFELFQRLIARSREEQARGLILEALNSPAPDKEKAALRAMLAQLDLKNKPVSLLFNALDGRKVDTAQMRGKLVLVSFWEPDEILELLSEKALYAEFHARGLESIGIVLGESNTKGRLKKLLKAQKIPWPQYFDGQGLASEMARRFGIYQSPTMMLLDKQGVLREINARNAGFEFLANGVKEKVGVVGVRDSPGSLEEKIKSLLAERP